MSQLTFTSGGKEQNPTFFVDAILPLPISKLFTYRVPRSMEPAIGIGYRIVVPFGKSQILTAVINNIHHNPPKDYEARYLIEVRDDSPSINNLQVKFYNWLANYYLCTPGEVLQAGLPSGLKVSTTSLVQLNPGFIEDDYVLSIEEQLLLQQLSEDKPVEVSKIKEHFGDKNYAKVIKSLINKDAILLIDHVKEKFSPKTRKYVRIANELLANEEELEQVVSQLEKKPKQLKVIMTYLKLLPVLEDKVINEEGLLQEELTNNGCSPSSMKTLAKHGIIEVYDKEVSRISKSINLKPPKELSDLQSRAKSEIIRGFNANKPVLLHGITGSGKTEIYIELIRETIDAGHQVLYLLPEIALTTQIVQRLQSVFGNEMGVYHSRYSANERVEVWKNLLNGRINLVVGVRSSILLPFSDLGLIIIDEEHDSSYKQYDPAPRYNARDSGIMLAKIHGSNTLLGTATPSLESYQHAIAKKYCLVNLVERHGGSVLPQISSVDLSKAYKRKQMHGNFSQDLIDSIRSTLLANEQVIVFQNRRGYAPLLSCSACGWVPQCKHCDISLTYHQFTNELKCHYCGFRMPKPNDCITCGSSEIHTVSFGTEQLEEELKQRFPETEIARLDLDTTRGLNSYTRIIEHFSNGKTQILVGTQMVTKGLDFDNVGLVAVINLDRMLHFPDFRSVERTFQLAVQVAGRAGRKKKQGKVIVQTYNPNQQIVPAIIKQDYQSFYDREIEERRIFNYPPFSRMTKIVVKDRDHDTVSNAATELYNLLIASLGKSIVLGPAVPSISRIRDNYLRELYIKIAKSMNSRMTKKVITESNKKLLAQKAYKTTKVVIDVDPV